MNAPGLFWRSLRKRTLGVLRHTPRLRWVVRLVYWRVRGWQYRRLSRRVSVDERIVLFESYGGRSYACSPKAIYEAMLADSRFNDYRFVWSFRSGYDTSQLPASSRTSVVTRGSGAYYRTLAQSGTLVLNTRLPEYVTPKSSQRFVQCWHGTPLKRLGFDVPDAAGGALNTSHELALRFRMDMSKWDYLISPSPYASMHLADAFGLPEGRRAQVIIEEGYPRNDALAHARRDAAYCTKMRRRLGVPDGKKALLYAPTWRDDSYKAGMGYTLSYLLDLAGLRKALGDEWVVLFRAHYYIANVFDFTEMDGFVIDVSRVDDVNEVYAASDVLLTDYSSVMFDFAVLRRPLLLFAPDLHHYEDDIRGFYIPLSEIPAPICYTTDEVVREICCLPCYEQRFGVRYKAFLERFAPKEDGCAAKRVLEEIFRSEG